MTSQQPNKASPPKVIAAMPAYNEEKYIGSVVLKARHYANEIIFLDDDSADYTADIARLAGAIVLQHTENKGYGAAIKSLLAEVKERKPDIFVLLNADSQHDPKDIPCLIEPTNKGFDLVIGPREGQKNNIPLYRRIGQKILLFSTHSLSGEKLSDSESGFRVFSRQAISVLEPDENGMAISAEVIADATKKGLKITEVPISVNYTRDSSTLNPIRHGLSVLTRILAMISERRPLFFFGLGGGIMVVLGLIAGARTLYIYSVQGTLPPGNTLLSVLLLTIGVLSIFTGIILYELTGRKR